MIIVVLILSVTMFLKQMQLLDNSRVYHAAMSEMEKQLTVEALRKAVVEEGVYPVMNWIQESIKLYKLDIISTLNLLNIDS